MQPDVSTAATRQAALAQRDRTVHGVRRSDSIRAGFSALSALSDGWSLRAL